jgi:hypothetical protein
MVSSIVSASVLRGSGVVAVWAIAPRLVSDVAEINAACDAHLRRCFLIFIAPSSFTLRWCLDLGNPVEPLPCLRHRGDADF